MEAFILVIIMTSGFMFTSRYPVARFKQLRSDGWDQYLHVFSWGLPFAILSFIFVSILDLFAKVDDLFCTYWIGFKFNENFSALVMFWSVFSLLFAWGCGYILSKIQKIIIKATVLCANENQLKQRVYEATKNGRFVQITLLNRKVYIGWIKTFMELKNPDTKYIKICPFFSGYRTEKRLIENITNVYCDYYPDFIFNEKYSEEQMKKILDDVLEPYTIVLPIENIVSIAYWDPDFYQMVNDNQNK